MLPSKKEWSYFLLGSILATAFFSVDVSKAETFVDDFVESIRDSGMAFGHRKHGDVDMRFRIQPGPTSSVLQFGNGQSPPFASIEAIEVANQTRGLFEFGAGTANAGRPIGITLNDRQTASISLSVDNGKLVIRDERRGTNHIMAIIDSNGIEFPQVGQSFP